MTAERLPTLSLALIPLLIWGLSYFYLARYHRRWNLLRVPIHESGRYTLLETVFYFNHFLRELPIDLFYAAAMAWALRALGVQGSGGQWSLWLALGLPALGAVGSLARVGLKNSLLDLLQWRELDSVVQWGSHWSMHWFSTWMLILAFALPGAAAAGADPRPLLALLAGFLALSILFRTGPSAWKEPRWLLHGGRELLTFGALLWLPLFPPLLLARGPAALEPRVTFLILAGGLLLGGLHLLRTARVHPVRQHAQRQLPVPYLLASHFFEHVLDWAWILALADRMLTP